MDCYGPAEEVSDGNGINNWTRVHFCDFWQNHVALKFWSKNIPET